MENNYTKMAIPDGLLFVLASFERLLTFSG